ncbi:hypothetical protein [Thermincola ferriacetica]
MALEKSVNEDDHIYEQDGFKIVISKAYDTDYNNLEIGWVKSYMGEGFSIYDTGKSGSCCDSGCGGC